LNWVGPVGGIDIVSHELVVAIGREFSIVVDVREAVDNARKLDIDGHDWWTRLGDFSVMKYGDGKNYDSLEFNIINLQRAIYKDVAEC
jgi:hypothetical protein